MPLGHTWRPLSGPLQPLIKLRSLHEARAATNYRGTPRERPRRAQRLLSPLAREVAKKRGRGAGRIPPPERVVTATLSVGTRWGCRDEDFMDGRVLSPVRSCFIRFSG